MSTVLYVASFVFITLSPVYGLATPRETSAAGWTSVLEPYDVYYHRYMALQCHEKYNTHFFDQCCRPLLVSESTSRPVPQCTVPVSASASTTPLPPTVTSTSFGGSNDCKATNESSCLKPGSAGPYWSPGQEREASSSRTNSASVSSRSLVAVTSTAAVDPVSPTHAHILSSSRLASMKKHSHILSLKHSSHSKSGQINTGGYATYFYQNGNAGACGTVHSDEDLIAAIDSERYGNLGTRSGLCGKKVRITNPSNHKFVVVTIADACPTCRNGNSIDLSLGAFKHIADPSQGIVGITWMYL